MRRAWVASLCVLSMVIAMHGSAKATETIVVTEDGAWWTSMTRGEKLIAVEGMLVGYDAGYESGVFEAAFKAVPTSANDLPRWVTPALKAQPDMSNRTFATTIDHLDAIFEHHPERSRWLVSPFFECAATRKSCAGLIRIRARG